MLSSYYLTTEKPSSEEFIFSGQCFPSELSWAQNLNLAWEGLLFWHAEQCWSVKGT